MRYITFLCLLVCLNSCKSIPPKLETKQAIQKRKETDSKHLVSEIREINETVSVNSLYMDSVDIIVETITWKFNPSGPIDTITGLHPLLEITSSVLSKGSKSKRIIMENKNSTESVQIDSVIESNINEQTNQLLEHKQEPGKDPYRWKYIAIIIGIISIIFVIITIKIII